MAEDKSNGWKAVSVFGVPVAMTILGPVRDRGKNKSRPSIPPKALAVSSVVPRNNDVGLLASAVTIVTTWFGAQFRP